jgi:hypothetical protein
MVEFMIRFGMQAESYEQFAPHTDMPLDPGIRDFVLILRSGGIETYESCEGGHGHAFPEPTIRFSGNNGEGFKALSIAMTYGLPVLALRRAWRMDDGELTGPWWEMTFRTREPRDAVTSLNEHSART